VNRFSARKSVTRELFANIDDDTGSVDLQTQAISGTSMVEETITRRVQNLAGCQSVRTPKSIGSRYRQ
jgi:hypothetical protein